MDALAPLAPFVRRYQRGIVVERTSDCSQLEPFTARLVEVIEACRAAEVDEWAADGLAHLYHTRQEEQRLEGAMS